MQQRMFMTGSAICRLSEPDWSLHIQSYNLVEIIWRY